MCTCVCDCIGGVCVSIYFRVIEEYLRKDGKRAFTCLSFKNVLIDAKTVCLFFFFCPPW